MSNKEPIDISAFATRQLSLLDKELQAEVAESSAVTQSHSPKALSRAGLAILNLTVVSQRTGLGGKTVLELGLDGAVANDDAFSDHGLRVGDIARLGVQPKGSERKLERDAAEKLGVNCVLVKSTANAVQVALDKEDADVPSGRLWLLKLANDVTYKRMNQAMTRLCKMPDAERSVLTRVLFGHSAPTTKTSGDDAKLVFTDPTLNESQRGAIHFALAAQELALIWGPPGTGKSHTLIELILQLLKQDCRVLVCGPSNISVDNIVERLAPHRVPMVRLGHPARLLPGVLEHCLEVLTRTSDAAALVRDIRKEMDAKQASIRKTRNGKEKRAIYLEMRELRKDYRHREEACVQDLVRSSKVVCATLHGAGGFHLKNERFDVVIVDEASQAMEASCWIPLLGSGARKIILAGDPKQLPPTIKSVEGTKRDESAPRLETTLFDRLLALYGSTVEVMLTTQYRMHDKIMSFPSTEMYDSRLIAAPAVRARLLCDLPYGVEDNEDTREPLIFYDTLGEFPEQAEDDEITTAKGSTLLGGSKRNALEAELVRKHVQSLFCAGVRPSDIAVLTPYNGQLAELSPLLKDEFPGIELGSIDGFQGREKEAVILTLVRSNPEKIVGFLGDSRRLNVAMTRPKRQLCVIGDSATISRGSKFLANWMKSLEDNADLRYPDTAH